MIRTLPFFVLILNLCVVTAAQQYKSLKLDGPNEVIQGLVYQVNADSIRSYQQSLQDFGSRFCLVENRREVAVWIKNKFVSFGIEQARLDSFQLDMNFMGQMYETWQYNVVATFPGTKNPEIVHILGAHHDSVCYDSSSDTPWECSMTNAPGADDNASGVAAALEVARLMMSNSYQPENTIKFITFAAEEVGLRGAWDYADKAASNGLNIQAVINNDMISHWQESAEKWRFQVHGYQGAEWLSDAAILVAGFYTSLDVVESGQFLNATDSWAFHQNGFPAVFFHEGQFSPFYHSVNDIVENTNKEYAAEVTKVSFSLLLHLNGVNLGSIVEQIPDGKIEAVVFPNPFSANTSIRLSLFQAQTVSVRVFDATGRLMFEKRPAILTPGTHIVEIDSSGFSGGLYLVSISSGNFSRTIRAVRR